MDQVTVDELIGALFSEEAGGGVEVTGAPGSGKSHLLAAISLGISRLGRRGSGSPRIGQLVIDPVGTLTERIRDLLICEPELVDRIDYISVADFQHPVPIAPLALAIDRNHPEWLAKLLVKTAETAKILLASWGELDFNSKPNLFKYTYYILEALAVHGLPLTAGRAFFEFHRPDYARLANLFTTEIARQEMLELAQLRLGERQELIGSTMNRFLGFTRTPAIQGLLSSPVGYDFGRAVREGRIVLVDLSPRGNLSESDRQAAANLWLNEPLSYFMNADPADWLPFVVMIDELALFQSSFPQLAEALGLVRKMNLRIIAAHLGTRTFRQGKDDPMFRAFLALAGLKFILRHTDPDDARFFGEFVRLHTFDRYEVKQEIYSEHQMQDGVDLMTLRGRARAASAGRALNFEESRQESSSRSREINSATDEATTVQQGSATADGVTSDDSEQFNHSQTRLDDPERTRINNSDGTARGHRQGTSHVNQQSNSIANRRGERRGTSLGNADSHGAGTSRGLTQTAATNDSQSVQETLVPRFRLVRQLVSREFWRFDEKAIQDASAITSFGQGEAIAYLAGVAVRSILIPALDNPLAICPRFVTRQRRRLEELSAAIRIPFHPTLAVELLNQLLAALPATANGARLALPAPPTAVTHPLIVDVD